ncbi:MAG TPA: glutamyl-tRNA reductase [Streptosporangiaceae bacterium]|nr:glutamyl-tRNA reductase [Streptosporangiaceae bacterium]
MSVLVVGLSHKSAPVATLERAVVTGDTLDKLLRDVFHADEVAASLVVSTCNRVEVYAEVEKFHGGLSAICELLARHAGIPLAELTPHLYVHYEDRAVQHLLSVACGLDSMVVGESQILGQVRQSLRLAREQGTLGRALSDLGSLALRAGKRAHAETGIGRAGASLVSVGLAAAAEQLQERRPDEGRPHRTGPRGSPGTEDTRDAPGLLAGLSVLVVGAGSMSSLAVATAARMGAARLVVANRSSARAGRLAATVSAGTADLSRLPDEIAAADLVVSCTGAPGHVISADAVAAGLASREPAAGESAPRALVLLDLALPRDVDPAAGQLPGVTVIGLDAVGDANGGAHEEDVAAVRLIVAEELAAHVSADRAARVAPTVVALRAKAAAVVDAELARLAGRLGGLDARGRREIAQSMRRIADKLLHAPTVRVKELAGSPGGDSYEAVLRVLFDLDPEAVQAVTRADAVAPGWQEPPATEAQT